VLRGFFDIRASPRQNSMRDSHSTDGEDRASDQEEQKKVSRQVCYPIYRGEWDKGDNHDIKTHDAKPGIHEL
jgi:hypothetical protein